MAVEMLATWCVRKLRGECTRTALWGDVLYQNVSATKGVRYSKKITIFFEVPKAAPPRDTGKDLTRATHVSTVVVSEQGAGRLGTGRWMPKSLRPNLYRTIKIVMSDGATFRVPSAVRTVGNTLQLDRDPANHPAYLVRAAASLAQSPCATEAHRESSPPRPVLLCRVRPISRVCLVVARSSALSECGPKPSRTSSISECCVGKATRVRVPCTHTVNVNDPDATLCLTPIACGSLHSEACGVRTRDHLFTSLGRGRRSAARRRTLHPAGPTGAGAHAMRPMPLRCLCLSFTLRHALFQISRN
jgi:ribosomal protein L31